MLKVNCVQKFTVQFDNRFGFVNRIKEKYFLFIFCSHVFSLILIYLIEYQIFIKSTKHQIIDMNAFEIT